MDKTTSNLTTLKEHNFYGQEKKNLAYVIGIMNMILHGIEAPNLTRINTLGQPLTDIEAKDSHDIILANPPFGGKERKEIQQNFPIKTGETASLFLQHFIKKLKAGGRAAIVIKNTFLSNTDNASIALREELLNACNIFAVLDMPAGTFTGAGVKTVVLFFQKGEPTQRIWYYQLNPGRSLGKTNPLNDKDLADFVTLAQALRQQQQGTDSPHSWTLNRADIDSNTFDLSPKNPNAPEEPPLRSPEDILAEMQALDSDTNDILESLMELI